MAAYQLTARAQAYVAALHKMPRKAVEAEYARVIEARDKPSMRFLARYDRYFLLTCILHREDCAHDWIFARIREVEADPDEHIDVWARGHYKSTIITFAGTIQDVLLDPEITICIFSHDKPAAKDFLSQVKQEFEKNDLLKGLFPEIFWANPEREAPWWSDDGGIVVKRKANMREATVEASGLVGGMSTGKHFAKRVYDDIVTEETVTSAEMIKKITERYELSEFLGNGQGQNRQQVIGTRYHHGDTYGVLLKRGALKLRKYPATDNGKADGNPVFLSPASWKDIKKKLSIGSVACQMLQEPLEGAETKFDIRWLKFWEVRPKRLNIYILMDPSKGRTESSDYTAMVVIGIDVNRNKYIVDGARARLKLSGRWTLLKETWKKWSAMPGIDSVFVGYEQFGVQTDNEYFEERMEVEKIYFPITEVMWPSEGRRSKEWRIERLEPDYRQGRLMLPGCYKLDADGALEVVDASRTKLGREMTQNRESFRIPEPIRRVDEGRKVYDFIGLLLEEYAFYPFAPNDDIHDAASRIYDMDPVPPIHYGEGNPVAAGLEPPQFVDT